MKAIDLSQLFAPRARAIEPAPPLASAADRVAVDRSAMARHASADRFAVPLDLHNAIPRHASAADRIAAPVDLRSAMRPATRRASADRIAVQVDLGSAIRPATRLADRLPASTS